MNNRRLTKRIEVWKTVSGPDGFGGYIATGEKVKEIWAEIRTLNNKNTDTDNGLLITDLGIAITVRLNKNFTWDISNNYIKYAGGVYTLLSYPTNPDFDNSFITFIAKRNSKVDEQN